MPFIHYPVVKVVRTTSFQPSLPACRSQAASTPQISDCPRLRSSQARAQLLSSTLVVATGPAEGSLCPFGVFTPLRSITASTESPAAPACCLWLLPRHSELVLIKLLFFAEKLFSWRCFPSRAGGWQRLANSSDLSLVCMLWPGERLSPCCRACLAAGRTFLSLLVTQTCAHFVQTGISQGRQTHLDHCQP